jgi:hypothetical protein
MKNQENYTTDNLEFFLSRIFGIYREIEFQLIQRERNEIRIERE